MRPFRYENIPNVCGLIEAFSIVLELLKRQWQRWETLAIYRHFSSPTL